jgi:hypothetical protein
MANVQNVKLNDAAGFEVITELVMQFYIPGYIAVQSVESHATFWGNELSASQWFHHKAEGGSEQP